MPCTAFHVTGTNEPSQTTELEGVFRDRYGFTTTRVVLDCKPKKPQTQLHLATSQFISDYDGPHRTTLLIVYYSGHGYRQQEENGAERLYISGYVHPSLLMILLITQNHQDSEHSNGL